MKDIDWVKWNHMHRWRLVIVWKIRVSLIGVLVWENFKECHLDYKNWKRHGHWAYFWPTIMTFNKFETMKEFNGP